ncbi:hypothetical protein DV737_g2495, partial [Chaetothyriales sp. CBS 132003]
MEATVAWPKEHITFSPTSKTNGSTGTTMVGRADAKTAQSQDSEYDESADSDFDVSGSESGDSDDSSEDKTENQRQQDDKGRSRDKQRQKISNQEQKEGAGVEELDSGDEATVKEGRKAARRRQRQRRKEAGAGQDQDDSGAEGERDEAAGGWRAKTRKGQSGSLAGTDKANGGAEEEMISITRTYQFAGEQHTERKMVAKSSAEGRLWLQQQEAGAKSAQPWQHTVDGEGRTIVRPVRKISRFDPNIGNIEAFKGQWATTAATQKGRRLNVVEKSKLDWASHVDAEGLKEELDVAAKAKDSYLHRTDFLRDVEMRKENEAREARMKGSALNTK